MRLSTIALIIATASISLAGVPAVAATYEADFSGPSLDPSLGFYAPVGTTVTVGGGFATLSYTADAVATTLNPVIYTNFLVSGDYVADVTVDFSGLPAIEGGSPGFYTDFNLLAQQGSLVAVGGYVDASGASNEKAFRTVNGVTTETGRETANGPSSVILRLTRVGDTLTQSFAWDGSSFTILGTNSGPEFAGPSGLSLAVFYSGTAATSGTVRFSNATITFPDAAPVPEPAEWALMIGDVAMIGGLAAQRRRATRVGMAG